MAANGLIGSQDFTLDACLIVGNSGQPYEFKYMVVELNYFEDLYSNSVTGNMLISDSSQFIEKLEFNGNEVLILKFTKPGLEFPIEKSFRIFSVSNRTLTNTTNENYKLNFCSEELYLSENILVSKSYKNKKVSDIVKDLTFNILKINPKKFLAANLEETDAVLNLIVPKMSPFETLNWLCYYAISKGSQTKGSSFFFYENREGFNFKSLQSLYKQQPYGTYTFEIKNMNNPDDARVRELSKDLHSVISYQHIKNYNALESTNNGSFSNRLITVNPIRLTYGVTDYDYNKEFVMTQKMNPMPLITNAIDRFGNSANTGYESVLKLAVSNSGNPANPYIKTHQTDTRENFIEETLPTRTAQVSQLDTNKIRLTIPGDPLIKVGDTLIFNLPSMSGVLDRSMDHFYSGKYLITAVRHKISQDSKFITMVEISKESLPNRYGMYNNESPAWKELRSR